MFSLWLWVMWVYGRMVLDMVLEDLVEYGMDGWDEFVGGQFYWVLVVCY